VYVLPNETMYKWVTTQRLATEMMQMSGFLSINFSGNLGVIKTRPGYASSIAYNIDSSGFEDFLGTIAGADTIFIALREGVSHDTVIDRLSTIIPNIR
jgi:transcriptional regulator of arginine metabolism